MRRSEALTASQLARCPLKDIQQQKPLVCVSPTVKTANLLFDNMLLLQSSKPALLLPLLVLLWPPSSDSCSFTPILNFGGLGAGGCPVSCLAVCVSFSSAVDSSRHIMKVVFIVGPLLFGLYSNGLFTSGL